MARTTPKSRTFRKLKVTTPGGKRTIHYGKRKPSKSVCGECGKPLEGVPRERPWKVRKLSKSERRPERPYGGVLCSECSRRKFIEAARK